MVTTFILDLAKLLVDLIFAVLPSLPQLDVSILTSLNGFVNLIFDHLDLLGFFVRISTIKTLVPLVILAANFDHIYHFSMWIIRKLPINAS